MSTNRQNTPDLIAYQVDKGETRSYWRRVGAAWKNKKGGFQVKLNAIPVHGDLVLLPRKED